MRNATVYGVSPRLRLDIVLNNLVAWAHTTGAIRLQSDGSSKFESTFPYCRFEWTAERGADELARAYSEAGLTFDDFVGHRYIRLGQLKRLLDARVLDAELRWKPAPTTVEREGAHVSSMQAA